MARGIDAQEKKWQRESDAHTLAEAESIKSSPGRLRGAKTEAKNMAKKIAKQAKSLNKVAKNTPKRSAPKKAVPKKAAPKRNTRAKKK